MAYIPTNHSFYNLLPYCTANGGDVFAFSSTDELEEILRDHYPPQVSLEPDGYESYTAYLSMLDDLASAYSQWPEAIAAIERYRTQLQDLNQKEKWSVCRYVGKNHGGIMGLTCGQTYYWPCSASHPDYIGVIDDQEFINYWYPPNPRFWLIVEDPTGMAAKTMIYYQETKKEKRQARLIG